ncbi:OTU domain-containing protein 7A [Anopheles darlingi]|uniref:ubiquitinyl hydrolase 1 n=1 Tax=Anopheles darlingi TaxID=43151 RepID=W5JL19_ANODA|nr:OTU domain-containing protein 7A [Anopheles darlingi]
MLTKTDSVDIFDCKKLERGISRATENVTLVCRARQEFEMDFHAHIHEQNDKNLNFIDTPDYTFTLPDLTKYTDDFRKFLEKDLIESSTLNSLETTNRLNWWYESGACRKLWPLATTGDGNCLLHAASLAMWGFHDRRLTLRRTLHDILSKEEFREALYRRWRFQQTRVNRQAGFVFCESEWAKEWEEIVAIASPEPRRNSKSNGPSRRRSLLIEKSFDCGSAAGTQGAVADDENATYESLEEIHVLALAHILRRTIIVVSDVFLRDINGEAFSPIPFGGVYLPFEVPSNECHRAPLLLAYDMAHFSALVAMEAPNDSPPALIPLVDATNQLLPIQFCIDPGKDFNWREYDGSDGNWTLTDREHIALLKEYLDIVHATGIESPDDEIYYEDYSDEEYEKKLSEGEIVLTPDEHYNNNVGGGTSTGTTGANSGSSSTATTMTASNQSLPGGGKDGGGKSKAAKQLQSVAKQFGSIGKSMSRKLRKNIGSITRIGSKNSGSKKAHLNEKAGLRGDYPRFRILCAQLKSRRHEYQEEMIKNYLECAQERYLEAEKMRERKELERLTKYVAEAGGQLHHEHDDSVIRGDVVGGTIMPEVDGGGLVNCINANCLNYGTAATSYMCLECYETQCKRESNCNSGGGSGGNGGYASEYAPRYGTGKSRFYAEADMEAHDRIQRIPSARRLKDLDQTLYLSRSTFYNDTRPSDTYSSGGTGLTYSQAAIAASPEFVRPGLPLKSQNHPHYHQHHHHPPVSGEAQSINHSQNQTSGSQQRAFYARCAATDMSAPFSSSGGEYLNCAKPPTGPYSNSSSTVSSSGGIVASIYSPGGAGNTGSINANQPYNRTTPAAAKCVVNLPPIATSGSQLAGSDIGKSSTSYGVGASSPADPSRSSQPFSSSSSSSSLGGGGAVTSTGLNGSGHFQSTAVTPVASSHYGKNQLCRTEGCKFYGSINTNFYCSKCCQEYNI